MPTFMFASASRRPADLLPRPGLGEYQRENWRPGGNVDVLYAVNNSGGEGLVRVFGPGFSEELPGFRRVNVGPQLNNGSNPLLIRKDGT